MTLSCATRENQTSIIGGKDLFAEHMPLITERQETRKKAEKREKSLLFEA